jgi:predicted permease
MKTLLFPHRFKLVGWIIFAISATIGAYIMFTDNTDSYLLNNIAIIGISIGAILATCSREKVEDEMTEQIRLNSLLVALYINYAILIVCSLLIYDLDFLQVMLYNMFTILLIFMAVFRWKIWRAKKGVEDEQ